MPTYPDTPFTDGAPWTPDLAYLAFHQQFGDSLDQNILGNHPGITDAQLSDTNNSIKNRVSLALDPLSITQVNPLTVNVSSGTVALTNGNLVTVPGSNRVLPDNKTNYLFVDSAGALQVSDNLPVVCYPVATVITSGGSISTITDLRQIGIRRIVPRPLSIKSFGGVNGTDIICTALTDLSAGLFYCRDFIVPSGVSITVPGWLRVYASRNVAIDGTLIISPITDGGDSTSHTPSTEAIVRGLNKGNGLGNTGNKYGWGFQSYGSGGYSGSCYSTSNVTFMQTPQGGKGGGGLIIESAGTITGSGTIQCRGSDGTGGFTYINGSPLVQTPGYFEPTTLASIYGSAGGSGGFISLSSLLGVQFSGTLDVRGGNGGLSMTNINLHFAGGGCPGSGGVIVITSPSYNISSATIQLGGGVFGATQHNVAGTTLSGSVYTVPNTVAFLFTGRPGASYGTSGGAWTVSTSGGNSIVTPVPAQSGLLVLREFVPLG